MFSLNEDKKKKPTPADGAVTPPQQPATKMPFEEWYKTVPSDRNDTSSYNLKRAYELAPMEELEAWRTAPIEDLKSGKSHLKSVYEDPSTGNYEFVKSKNHPTVNKELEWYNSNDPEAVKFRREYKLDTSGDYYKYVKAKEMEPPVIPEKSAPGYSAQLSTWLQHYDPNQENQPLVTEQQTPAEQVGMSEKASVWQPGTDVYDWMKAIYGDPEEDAARERRNRTILGITAVGDALRHFGNIYHTTKGAPAQTLTNATKEESDRQIKDTALLQQQRQKTSEMLLKHQKMEADRLYRQQEAQRKNYELALKEENLRQQAAYRQKQGEQIDARIKNLSDRLAFDVEKQKHKVDYDNQVLGLRKATEQRMRWYQGEMVKLKRQSNAIAAQRAANALKRGRGLLSQGSGDSVYYAAGSAWGVPKALKNKSNARSVYNMLPKDVRRKNPATTEEDMISVIIDNVDAPGISKALGDMGVYNLGAVDWQDIIENGSELLKSKFLEAFEDDDQSNYEDPDADSEFEIENW